ncbi:short-chain dehydrogenase/reductase family 16C member 6-like [Formica exsecta]|uniref:short-chain dehydrogenase/reductase family 16C member 6-like n=1 Tax=Formica exsecta TaxID=72781 RepID=UPI0011412949|nr:short-chain dehydrogenase/reductase family 16C member 6-like [Formica exsecta]XP_029663821.1 short-chain dehydrogenase/reductase family 16C member 6-like [Formica exsecta]
MIILHKIIYILANISRLSLQILYYICESIYYKIFGLQKKSVAGEIVLITGAGHGIGKELAIQYALLGAIVVCIDVNQQSNEKVANEIKEIKKTSVYTYQCDVSNRKQVFEVAKKIKQEIGDVTVLINNAGIMPCHKFLDYISDQITRVFDINVLAHIWMLEAFLPSMIEKNHGHIVALSSLAGLAGVPYLVPYSATKFAVKGLMETLEQELRTSSQGKSLIKFSTIYPYMSDTGLCKKPKVNKMLSSFMPLNTSQYVAAEIINAQRQNVCNLTVPSFWLLCFSLIRFLPEKAQNKVRDFLDAYVEPEN